MDCIFYIDLFFLWNFWMNVLVLFLVRQLTRTYRTLQCIFAAALGAFAACWSLVWYINGNPFVSLGVFEAAIMVCMNLLAFGVKNILWHLFLFFLSQAAVAGVFLFLIVQYGISRDILAIVAVSLVAGIFCVLLEKQSRIRWKEEHMKVKTVLEFGDRKLFATALMDTGNKLYDPFFHKPVILVDEKMMSDMLLYCRLKEPWKYHCIPFHSVGKENGMLEGITFDCVSIKWQNKQMKFYDVIAAATKESLYKGKEYQVIFHCGLLQEQ